MEHSFDLESGTSVVVSVKEGEACTTVSQAFTLADGTGTKTCTVTCHATGKSHSWNCNSNQSCEGNCSDPNNPTGRCV